MVALLELPGLVVADRQGDDRIDAIIHVVGTNRQHEQGGNNLTVHVSRDVARQPDDMAAGVLSSKERGSCSAFNVTRVLAVRWHEHRDVAVDSGGPMKPRR